MGTPVARRVATRGYTSGLVAIGERNHYSFPRRWITLDHRDADFTMRLGPTSELPLPDDSVHIVYSAHILEHLDDATISGVLSDVYRILRPGGAVRVEVPDADFLVDAGGGVTSARCAISGRTARRSSSTNSALDPSTSKIT